MKYSVRVQGREYKVEIEGDRPGYRINIDGRPFQVDAANLGDDALLTMILDNESLLAQLALPSDPIWRQGAIRSRPDLPHIGSRLAVCQRESLKSFSEKAPSHPSNPGGWRK